MSVISEWIAALRARRALGVLNPVEHPHLYAYATRSPAEREAARDAWVKKVCDDFEAKIVRNRAAKEQA